MLSFNFSKQEVTSTFPLKFTNEDLQNIINEIKKEDHKNIIILIDVDIGLDRFNDKYTFIDCTKNQLTDIDHLDFKQTIFIYACQFDDIGYPFVKKIISKEGTLVPVRKFGPSTYSTIHSTVYQALSTELDYQLSEDFSKFNKPDFENLCQAIDTTRNCEGVYIEIGCFRGSSGSALGSYLSKTNHKLDCWFLDVFEGFTYKEAKKASDNFWYGSHKTEGLETVSNRLKRFESENIGINVRKSNIITDALPDEIKKIRVANLDVDIYEGTKVGLEKLAPLIVKGGILICEDVGHTPRLIAARSAFWEWVEESPLAKKFTIITMASGQVFCVRISD